MRSLALVVVCVVGLGCGRDEERGPFEQLESAVWRLVNRSHTGADGIFVQATLHTMAFELAQAYARAEKEGLDQGQLKSRLQTLIHTFVDAKYPAEDGTDINNLYLQYLVFVDPDFDAGNPLEKKVFDAFRANYIRQLLDKVYDRNQPTLRREYDERWGITLYSRLVFSIYLDNKESDLSPAIADIGERTFLLDDQGQRYRSSGLAGPYPYKGSRPKSETLEGEAIYQLFFPNRKSDRKTPIITKDSKYIELVIEGLGDVPERRLRWDFPLQYPELRLSRPAGTDSLAAPIEIGDEATPLPPTRLGGDK